MEEGAVLSRFGAGIVLAAIVSTLLTMIVTVLVFQWALERFGTRDAASSADGGEGG
jgi:putative effector of murein hydrolase LrgA (UPF0299 family)